jgi:hypothetical protein
LTKFFNLNFDDAIGAEGKRVRTLYYKEVPAYFWWDKPKRLWIARKRKESTVGQVF